MKTVQSLRGLPSPSRPSHGLHPIRARSIARRATAAPSEPPPLKLPPHLEATRPIAPQLPSLRLAFGLATHVGLPVAELLPQPPLVLARLVPPSAHRLVRALSEVTLVVADVVAVDRHAARLEPLDDPCTCNPGTLAAARVRESRYARRRTHKAWPHAAGKTVRRV